MAEMGVIGAFFTEEQGGFGGTGADIALIFEELGRANGREPVSGQCAIIRSCSGRGW